MKKIVCCFLAGLALSVAVIGCGQTQAPAAQQNEVPPHWTEIARQNGYGHSIVTYVDSDNHEIVVVQGGANTVSMTRIR